MTTTQNARSIDLISRDFFREKPMRVTLSFDRWPKHGGMISVVP
jgi:hypothetical protein